MIDHKTPQILVFSWHRGPSKKLTSMRLLLKRFQEAWWAGRELIRINPFTVICGMLLTGQFFYILNTRWRRHTNFTHASGVCVKFMRRQQRVFEINNLPCQKHGAYYYHERIHWLSVFAWTIHELSCWSSVKSGSCYWCTAPWSLQLWLDIFQCHMQIICLCNDTCPFCTQTWCVSDILLFHGLKGQYRLDQQSVEAEC